MRSYRGVLNGAVGFRWFARAMVQPGAAQFNRSGIYYENRDYLSLDSKFIRHEQGLEAV